MCHEIASPKALKALENEDTLAVEHLLKLKASPKEAGRLTSGEGPEGQSKLMGEFVVGPCKLW